MDYSLDGKGSRASSFLFSSSSSQSSVPACALDGTLIIGMIVTGLLALFSAHVMGLKCHRRRRRRRRRANSGSSRRLNGSRSGARSSSSDLARPLTISTSFGNSDDEEDFDVEEQIARTRTVQRGRLNAHDPSMLFVQLVFSSSLAVLFLQALEFGGKAVSGHCAVTASAVFWASAWRQLSYFTWDTGMFAAFCAGSWLWCRSLMINRTGRIWVFNCAAFAVLRLVLLGFSWKRYKGEVTCILATSLQYCISLHNASPSRGCANTTAVPAHACETHTVSNPIFGLQCTVTTWYLGTIVGYFYGSIRWRRRLVSMNAKLHRSTGAYIFLIFALAFALFTLREVFALLLEFHGKNPEGGALGLGPYALAACTSWLQVIPLLVILKFCVHPSHSASFSPNSSFVGKSDDSGLFSPVVGSGPLRVRNRRFFADDDDEGKVDDTICVQVVLNGLFSLTPRRSGDEYDLMTLCEMQFPCFVVASRRKEEGWVEASRTEVKMMTPNECASFFTTLTLPWSFPEAASIADQDDLGEKDMRFDVYRVRDLDVSALSVDIVHETTDAMVVGTYKAKSSELFSREMVTRCCARRVDVSVRSQYGWKSVTMWLRCLGFPETYSSHPRSMFMSSAIQIRDLDSRNVASEEHAWECPYSRYVAREVAKARLARITSAHPTSKSIEARMISHFLSEAEKRPGSGFKASKQKMKYMFFPTNLHLMWHIVRPLRRTMCDGDDCDCRECRDFRAISEECLVRQISKASHTSGEASPGEDGRLTRRRAASEDQTRSKIACFPFVSVGAFAAHPLKFKQGGLRRMLLRKDAESGDRDPSLENDIAFRSHVVFTQALCACVSTFVALVNAKYRYSSFDGFVSFLRVLNEGFLFNVESLLSTHGKETGMIEDTDAAMDLLSGVKINLCVDVAVDETSPARGRDAVSSGSGAVALDSFGDLPMSCIRREGDRGFEPSDANNEWCTITVNASFAAADVASAAILQAALPIEPISVIPLFFTQGINEKQTVSRIIGTTSMQFDINSRSSRILFGHYSRLLKAGVSVPVDQQQMARFLRIIKDSEGKSKCVDVLSASSDIVRLLMGGRVTMCKSAKDRTAMSVTLEQARLLSVYHGLPPELIISTANELRAHGLRLDIVKKNINHRCYAFNRIQRSLIPQEYRCPDKCLKHSSKVQS